MEENRISEEEAICNQKSVRIRSCNLVFCAPGTIISARNIKSHNECYKLFLDDNIIWNVTECTNICITSIEHQFEREWNVRLTDECEISAIIGFLILAGTPCGGHQKTRGIKMSVVYQNVTVLYVFRDLYFYYGVHYLIECINDRMWINWDLSEKKWDGLKWVSTKYGIKEFTLSDGETMHFKTTEIHTGCHLEGPYNLSNTPTDIVIHLVKTIQRTSQNVTANNWFISIYWWQSFGKWQILTLWR